MVATILGIMMSSRMSIRRRRFPLPQPRHMPGISKPWFSYSAARCMRVSSTTKIFRLVYYSFLWFLSASPCHRGRFIRADIASPTRADCSWETPAALQCRRKSILPTVTNDFFQPLLRLQTPPGEGNDQQRFRGNLWEVWYENPSPFEEPKSAQLAICQAIAPNWSQACPRSSSQAAL